jgi:protein transport protein SEC24
MFVIDVSASAVASGMLQTTVEAIKDSLDMLPGSPRTQVGFLTYDSTIHFYNLKATLNQPQMMVVSPLQEVRVCWS